MLLGATALGGLLAAGMGDALAQVVIDQNGPSAPDRGPGGYDADGDNGDPGGTAAGTNNVDQLNINGTAFLGTANGGKGGNGGYGAAGTPLHTNGGEGGNGGQGGTVDITNNAHLTTIGDDHYGMAATAKGGNGGDGGGAAPAATAESGDAGSGNSGGTASATASATSIISTTGNRSFGIYSDASGGNGGQGGDFDPTLIGAGGDGGNGASGGNASASNAGSVDTSGTYAYGMLVRSAGGSGGNGKGGPGLISEGGNGGAATIGGSAEGTNTASGSIVTRGDFASGMVVQSVGGAGGGGGGAFGFFGGGGTGGPGNEGGTATGTNAGTITTNGVGAIGMLVESVGGGGGDGGGAIGSIALGGKGGGGGKGGNVFGHIGGTVTTGADGSGDGAHGIVIQSIGGGGGNGGFAFGIGNVASIGVGGSGGTASDGGNVDVQQEGGGPTVSTSGAEAIGILAQSIGGGGGSGGSTAAVGGVASLAIGGKGGAGGAGGNVVYNVGHSQVTTNGVGSTGILTQSVGGGGGNGGFAAAVAAGAAVGVGGTGGAGGKGGTVNTTTGGTVETHQDRSVGIVAQSIGGGGGNGGGAISGSLGVSVAIGRKGGGGGAGDSVTFDGTTSNVTTHGKDSTGILVQSVGGGGGNGGFSVAVAGAVSVGIGGSGGAAGKGGIVDAKSNGNVETWQDRSAGIVIQSIGGGGGNGGVSVGLGGIASVGLGGDGGGGGEGDSVTYRTDNSTITTHGADSAGILVQSVGGGGGNGGFELGLASVASLGIGGKGGVGADGGVVKATVTAGTIRTYQDRSSGLIAQSIGGGGGNGGATISASTALNIAVGGKGSGGGNSKTVDVTNGANITTGGDDVNVGVQSHAILAQSIGGGGGSGGFAVAVGGPSLAVGGDGNAGGTSEKVTVKNTGTLWTGGNMSIGLLAQSIGGSGGDGGFAGAGGLFTAVGVGGKGGAGGGGGEVSVTNNANITTKGSLAHGILAQSVGGGGGNGGSAGALSVGAFVGVSVAVGGSGGEGRDAKAVDVTHHGNISVSGEGSKAIIAQSIGGGGGNGGKAYAGAFSAGLYGSVGVAVTVGGSGGDGGSGGSVTLKADGNITAETDATGSGGVVAQSIGGGGGNGGRALSVAGAVSTSVAVNLGVAIGGGGGNGGQGGTVRVETGLDGGGSITTKGFQSVGILAQSIGGGGGNGGDTLGGAGGFGSNVTVSASVNIGGSGGGCVDDDPARCNSAGDVHVTNAMSVTTGGDSSSAIVAQSIGGGGGNGGTSAGGTANLGGGSGVNIAANFAMGGGAGAGAFGNTVDVINSGNLTTTGAFSSGIVAQSIGGGGGIGGSSTAKSYNVGGTSQTSVSVNMGLSGHGGTGGYASKVTVDNSGIISTQGFGSNGIMAMSVGGGGGAAGAASASDETVGGGGSSGGSGGGSGTTSVSIGFALATAGGTAGDGGAVSVTNRSSITTNGGFSYGISASSIGGGGGVGGSATAGAQATYAIGGAIAGKGGSAGNGALVEVTNEASGQIWTKQENSIGILAQSIGGGGGAGGAGKSTGSGDATTVDVKFSMGGAGAGGGNGGEVHVTNSGLIETDMANSHGIMAQSIGGSGGVGGAAGSEAAQAKVTIGASLGGEGGAGGYGQFVHVVNNATGTILTNGDNSYGIFAQSIGGGGGAAGAGSTKTAAAKEVAVNLSVGGIGGNASRGGDVTVENHGQITTYGYLSHGIFAQSVGGGGGASGAAANATEGDSQIGGKVLAVGVSLPAGEGANGGHVIVKNDGVIETMKAGAIGIFAQSIGGGGGYGGTVSTNAAGDNAFALQIGGFGGNGGDGGAVEVTVSGAIITHGARAHGVVAESIGGGGGYGGDANGKTSNALAIGGVGANGGNGGDVTVIRTGTITTYGVDSIAIIAQSIGGGGGFGGAGFGRFGADDNGGGPNAVGFNSPGGSKGNGGKVTIIQSGAIETDGDRSHGIVAQAVGGGGGAGGNSSLNLNQSAAGSQGGIGDAAAAEASTDSQVWVKGASSYAMFGQSATGQGNSNLVHLTAGGSLFAQGADSVAAYGESTAQGTKGNITIDLQGKYTIGGANTGVAVMLVGGATNTVNNNSLLYAMGANPTFSIMQSSFAAFNASLADPGPVVPKDAILQSLLGQFSPLSITGTSGDDTVNNEKSATGLGRVIGNIDLGGGTNAFNNFEDSSMVGLKSINLGGGLFKNAGLMTNQGIGVVATVDITGGYTQTSTGDFVTDIDLDNQITDKLVLTGTGTFDGTAPLNFLSIDKLFTHYTLATGASMTDAYLTPKTLHPAVGFNFLTRVDNGTDLVIYADNPTFLQLAQNPGSGTTDPGVYQMAQYLDDVEASSSPDNPMARLINMLRFSQTEAELGAALTRLTPHYAVHTFDMINRSADIMLESARECTRVPAYANPDGRCVWANISPQAEYKRDTGAGTTDRDDVLKTMSLGGIGEVGQNWSLGATLGRTEFDSKIHYNQDLLSETTGESWQIYGLAKYENKNYFVDFALGGGTGSFEGKRDTHIDQVGYIPGETLEGVYLPELLLDGIGNSVSYTQKTAQFGGSARLGFTQQMGAFYLQPTVQFDARWLRVSGSETGSVAAFTFDGTSNTYYSATPGIEIGTDIPLSDIASLRVYGKAGVEFSNKEWEIQGQFTAAQNLPGSPALHLTEAVDSPLYRVGAGLELNGVNGVGLSVRYNGAFGESVKQNAVSAALKVSF